jgi:hypothetical protein
MMESRINVANAAVEKREEMGLSWPAWQTALELSILPSSVTALADPEKRDPRNDAFSYIQDDFSNAGGWVSWDLVIRILEFHEKGLILLRGGGEE